MREMVCRGSRDVPLISVVVPTHGRSDLLRRSLQALTTEDYPPKRIEIIVVDNGNPGPCQSVVEEAAARAEMDIRYLTVPHGGPAAARNAGWRTARGEIIAFTDVDTIPSPRWIAEGVAAFREGADVVSGRTVVPLPARPTDAQRTTQGLERATLAACNAFCRRELLDATGGFTPRGSRADREDRDLELPFITVGARLVHHAPAVVLHPLREEPRWSGARSL